MCQPADGWTSTVESQRLPALSAIQQGMIQKCDMHVNIKFLSLHRDSMGGSHATVVLNAVIKLQSP